MKSPVPLLAFGISIFSRSQAAPVAPVSSADNGVRYLFVLCVTMQANRIEESTDFMAVVILTQPPGLTLLWKNQTLPTPWETRHTRKSSTNFGLLPR